MRRKDQLTRDRVRLQNQLESLLEEAHQIVGPGIGSAGRQCAAYAAGPGRRGNQSSNYGATGRPELTRHPATVVRRTRGFCGPQAGLSPAAEDGAGRVAIHRTADGPIGPGDRGSAGQQQTAVQRLAEVPGLGVDSAQQIIAEVGSAAATFPSEKQLASWVGVCPGEEESAGVSASNRSPKGNRFMRRVLNQAANAAVKVKGSIFEIVFRRLCRAWVLPTGHLGNCPSPLSPDLENSASRRPLRGKGPSCEPKIERRTHCKDDPRTPKPGLQRRTVK